ncbi:MAG: hypothetical protein ACK42L_07925, partial [Thermoanaerobaculum sp.]
MSWPVPTWRQAQLEAILELSLALGGPREENELVEELVNRAVGLLDARRGLVVALRPEGMVSSWAAVQWQGQPQEFFRAFRARHAEDAVQVFAGTELGLPYRQVMVAPGSWQGEWVLLVAVADRETREGEGDFTSDDATFLRSLSLLA